MEAERIDNIIKIFEAFEKGKEKKEEPAIAFSETLKKRPKKIEEERLFVPAASDEVDRGLGVDTLSISKEAREAYELVKIVKIIRETPDVRSDKVKEARREMEDGGLFMKKVNETIAERLIH